MALNPVQLIAEAQAFSPQRLYQPEASPDYPLHRALVEQVNAELAATGTKVNYEHLATITGNVAASAATEFTVPSDNYAAQGYLLLMMVEHDAGSASGGQLDFTIRWTYNGAPAADTATMALNGGAGAGFNSGYYLFLADIGTAVTWEYAVTLFGTGTVNVRMLASFTRLI